MKTFLLGTVAVSALMGAPAVAADLPAKVARTPAVASSAFNWTGCYVGVHAGGGVLFDAGWQEGAVPFDRHGSGAVAGGQVGCNYQTGMLVVGIEGEGFWSGIGNTVDQFAGNAWWSTVHVKNKADYDVAARFGVAFDRALVYGKAGWVWGKFNWDQTGPNNYTANASATLDGLLIGLGLEYALTYNWTAKFEYDYLGFDAKNVLVTTNVPSTYTQNVSVDKHIFKLGLNYKFDWGQAPLTAAMAAPAAALPFKAPAHATAVAARPFSWTGCYVGVHVGGGVLFDAGAQQSQLDRHGSGAVAGGQIGCNYQTGMLVVGIEGEGFWSGIGNTVDQFTGNTWFSTGHVNNKADYDIAARFGVAFDRALVYGKAGWVWGQFAWDYKNQFNYTENASATLDGLLIGLGLEYAIATNWTAKFEYDYLGFEAKNVVFTTSSPSTYTQNVSADKHIFKVGLNYKFTGDNAPLAAAIPVKAAAAVGPTYNWNGCYVGAHVGGGVLFDAGAQLSAADRHGTGALAGGQIGCNYQTGMLVVGIEGEAFWSGIGNTVDQFTGNTWFSTAHVKNKADYDIAARFGVAFDRALVYGKAGWVWGQFAWDYKDQFNYTENASATLNGLLIGLGLEYGITVNWTAKFEYDYLGYDAKNVVFTTNTPSTNTQNVSADKHIFKVGLNYKFDWAKAPVIAAKY